MAGLATSGRRGRLSASFRGDLDLTTRNHVINVNLFLTVAASAAGGLFCRARWRDRVGSALRAGVYAFVAYLVIVLLSVRIME